MAGQSGHNLSIAKSKLGCRFPFESPNAGDGYAASGPCLVRKMTPEEKARYGAAVVPKDRDLRRGEAAFAVDNATSLEHAAKMARVSVARMKKEMARHCIAVPEGWKGDETVNDIGKIMDDNRENLDSKVQANIESPENQASGMDEKQGDLDKVVQGQPAEGQEDKPKTRREILQEKLTKDQYLALKEEGLSDREVLKKIGVPVWVDVLTDMKHKWGLSITVLSPPKQKQEPPREKPKEEPKEKASELHYRIENIRQHLAEREEEPRAQTPTPGLTINEAIALREKFAEDTDDLDHIIGVYEGEISERVLKVLIGHRDICKRDMDRIDEVFKKTVLPL